MSLFHHTLQFQPADPLADGLGDEIAAEQAEPEHFELNEQLDGTLAEAWAEVLDSVNEE